MNVANDRSLAQIQATVPGLLIWMRRVFWVM